MKLSISILYLNMEVEILEIDIDKNDNLNKIKNYIYQTKFIYPDEQLWFSNNIVINNNEIKWNFLNNYSIIVNNKWYKFIIKTITNSIIHINFLTSQDLIIKIKSEINKKFNYNFKYKLKYNDIILNDDHCIGKYFIPEKVYNLNMTY